MRREDAEAGIHQIIDIYRAVNNVVETLIGVNPKPERRYPI